MNQLVAKQKKYSKGAFARSVGGNAKRRWQCYEANHMTPRILMVGAGAVGQVFAWYLTQGGAQVTFFVKPAHALGDQLPLLRQVRHPVTLSGFGHLRSVEAVAQQAWHQVWLAVPSNTLAGEWLPPLLNATGTSTVVALAAEGAHHIAASRLVMGSIPFIAWQDPLPGHTAASRLAFWVPPLAAVPLSGQEAERVEAVRAVLTRGGLRGAIVKDTAELGRPVTALLMSSVAALEGAGWSLRAFRGHWSSLAGRAAHELMRGERVRPLWWVLAQGHFVNAVFWLGTKVLPFDLEAYLEYHFTKVGEQTRAFLRQKVSDAKARGLATPAVEELLSSLTAARS